MKSKRSKATDIPKKVKEIVWERDKRKCVFCGSTFSAAPNAHVISRAKGGLGVEKNIITLCLDCHYIMDQTVGRKMYLQKAKNYLKSIYEDWNEEELIYKKF